MQGKICEVTGLIGFRNNLKINTAQSICLAPNELGKRTEGFVYIVKLSALLLRQTENVMYQIIETLLY